jgi:hypothetical protein
VWLARNHCSRLIDSYKEGASRGRVGGHTCSHAFWNERSLVQSQTVLQHLLQHLKRGEAS